MINNYQAQQDLNSIIGFATVIMTAGFMVGMTGTLGGLFKEAMKEPYTIHPWLYDKFGGKKLQSAPWEERYKVAQRIGAQLDLEYNIPCKAQKVGTVEIPIDYWNKNKDHVADVLDEITGIKHRRPWRKELSSSNMEIERLAGFIVRVGGVEVRSVNLPDWPLDYIEYPPGKRAEYREALTWAKAKVRTVKFTDKRIYFEQ